MENVKGEFGIPRSNDNSGKTEFSTGKKFTRENSLFRKIILNLLMLVEQMEEG